MTQSVLPTDHKEQASHRSRLRRRRNALIGTGVGAGLLAVGGLVGASFVKSPAQLAADTAAPAPTVVTAPVVSQILTSSVQMRGLIFPATEYDVYATAPSPAAGASGSSSSGSGSTPTYITRLDVAAGAAISSGEQLAEIDGAPLLALAGDVPMWRDLAPGDSGPDVLELQKALATLGYYDEGDTAGYYGSATEYAVTLYFDHLGYTPPSNGGLPAADVVFLPSLPATVIAVNGSTGTEPGQPFLELAAKGALALTGELPPGYAGQVKAGLKVTVYDEVTGFRTTGTVSDLGTATTTAPTGTVVDVGSVPASSSSSGSGSSGSGSSGSGSSGSGSSGSGSTTFIPLDVRTARAMPAAENGENVLVTVDTGRTEGPVLSVPVAAIVTTAAGTSFVTVVGADRKQAQVPVTPGISENGYVQVTPVTPGALSAGQNVVVSS
ncbi:MAG TPA: peptidoglycan-binding domain-containing protein [Trebonia sp.]|nr:peptidoglycan-binding domain-containing protein [Trebonia sp.]